MITAIKISTAIGWLIILANWLMPFAGQLQLILHWSGIGLAAAHALEALIYIPFMKKAGGNIANHMLQTLLFGYGHFLSLQESIKAKQVEAN